MKDYNSKIGNVSFIETFGAFDGPGIRYVLFLQGCPLRCKFCHNRDTWETTQNRLMSVDEILADYNKYKTYYRKGGITVGGGEATLQLPFLTNLFKACKEQGIHTCLDTSAGLFNQKNITEYDELIKYTDLVLLDIKAINNETHKWLVGVPNTHILEFANYLDQKRVPTILRHILVPGINSSIDDLTQLRMFDDKLSNIIGIDVLPYHKKGIMKWEKMGIKYPLQDVEEPTTELIQQAEKILKQNYKFLNQST